MMEGVVIQDQLVVYNMALEYIEKPLFQYSM